MNSFVKIFESAIVNQKFIIPTTKYLEYRFKYFNNAMFEGKLPFVKVGVPTDDVFAVCECKFNCSDTGDIEVAVINVNSRFLINNDTIDDVLLHEMIHLENIVFFKEELMINGVLDRNKEHTSRCFVSEMSRLNSTFKRNIKVKFDVYDTSKFKVTRRYKTKNHKVMNDTTFYCIHIDGKRVFVYKLRDSKDSKLIYEIKEKYKNCYIEELKPKNPYETEGYYAKSISYPLVYTDGADFDKFKNNIESVMESMNNCNMPKWVEDAMKIGLRVTFENGKWFAAFVD